MGEERTPRRLFVGGLFQGITDKDLQDRFARFGDVTGVDVRARKDDVGNVLKTFAYLNMTISDKDYKKCMATFNKTKWRGNEMQIQIAKESFVDRLKREQEEARSKAGQPKETPTAEPVNLHVKGAVPGTAVEGKPDWVVGKYGVALPVVNLRTKNKKKVIKVDPSKYVHAVKKFEHGKKAEVTTKEADAPVNGLTWHMEVEEKDILKKIKGEFPPTANKRKSLTPKKLKALVQSEDSHVTATNDSKVENAYHSNTDSCDSDQGSSPKKKRAKKAPVSEMKQKNVTLKEEDLQVDCSPAKRKRTISETSTPSAGKDRRNRVVSPDVSIIEAPVNGTPTKSSVSNATAILQQIKLASKKKRKLSSASEEKSKVQPEDLDSSKSKLVKKVTNGKDKKAQQNVSSNISSSEDEQVANTSKTKSPGSKTLKPNKPAKVVQQESSDDSSSSSDSDQQKPPAKKMKPLSKSPAATVVKETKSPVQKAKKAKGKPTPDTSKVIQIEFDADIGAGSGDEFVAQPKNIQARKAQLRPTPMHQQPRFAQVPSVDEFGVGLLVDDKSAGITDEERKWKKYNSGGFSSDEDLLDAVSQGRVTKLDRIAKVATQRSQFVETPSLIYPEAGKKPFTPQKVYNSDTDEEDERFQTVQTQPKRVKVKQPQTQNISLTTGSSSQGDNQLKKKGTNKPNHTSGYAANSESEISIKEKVKQKKLGNKKAIPKKDTDDSSTDEESLPQQSKQKPKRKEMKKNVKGKQLKTADSSPESESDSDSETEVKVPVGKLQIKKSDKSNQRESSDSSKSESGTDTMTKVQKPVTSNLHKSVTSSKSKQEDSESSDSDSSHSDSSDSESEKQVEKSPAVKSPFKKLSISKQKEVPDSSDSESSDSESDKGDQKQISKTVQIKKPLSDPKPEETSSSSDSSESETEKAPKQQKTAKVQPNSKANVSKVTQQKQSSSDSDSSDTDSSSSSSSGVTNKTVPKSPATAAKAVKLPPFGLKEKNPSKAVAPTPPTKGKVAPAAQSKKSLDANQKRLETLKQRTHEAQAQKNLLKNALASVDSQPSKKIIFDSDDEDVKMQSPSKPTTVTNGVIKRTKLPQSSSDSSDSQSSDDSSDAETKAKEKKAPTLFEDSQDSSSEDEDAEDRFRVRPQFEGKAGSKLISLQSRFANDPRFKITEKFLDEDGEKEDSEESSDEDKMEEAQQETMDNDSTNAERERAMAILKDVVGGGAVKQGKKNKAVTFKDMSTRHYDPTKDDHKQFELQVETKKKEKKKKQKVVEEEVQPESAPVPEVSGERFFQVETSLKDMFNKDKAVQDQPFSLLAMLGRDNEETTDNTRKVQEDGKGSVLQQVKSPWQQQFGSDDSDDEDRGSEAEASRNFPDVEMAEVKTEIPKVKAVSHGFFFIQNDPRIADGIDFFRRKEDLEVVRRKWAEERPALVEAYRAKRRRFRFMKKDGNMSASPNRAGFGGRGRGRGGGRGRGRGGRR